MGLKYTDATNVGTLTGAERWGVSQGGSPKGLDLDEAVTWKKTATTTAATYTIADNGIGVLEVNVGTCTVTLPSLATWGGRSIIIRKISSTAGTVTIARAGSDVITRADSTSITLTSEGDYWELFAGSTIWDLSAGVEIITNAAGESIKTANGKMVTSLIYTGSAAFVTSTLGGFYNATIPADRTYPATFTAIPSVSGTASHAASWAFAGFVGSPSTTNHGLTPICLISSASGAYRLYVTATGRWYA